MANKACMLYCTTMIDRIMKVVLFSINIFTHTEHMTRRLERSFTMNDEEFVEKYTSRRRAGRYEPLTGINNDTLEGTDNNDDQITETKIPKIIEVNRIRLLTDGVIAVAITLLIVELKGMQIY